MKQTFILVGAALALGACGQSDYSSGLNCPEDTTSLTPGEVSSFGFSPAEALAAFPSEWEVAWEDLNHPGQSATPDTVTFTLTMQDAEEVTTLPGHSPGCPYPAPETFVRLTVTGAVSTADGSASGAVEGYLEMQDLEMRALEMSEWELCDPGECQAPIDTWRFSLHSPVAELKGDRRTAAEAVAEANDLAVKNYRLSFITDRRTFVVQPAIVIGLQGTHTDGGSRSLGLWQAEAPIPAQE